ncbi:MAG TPA: hypothetical protein VGB92_16030, partial [Longimicrobium sp.]
MLPFAYENLVVPAAPLGARASTAVIRRPDRPFTARHPGQASGGVQDVPAFRKRRGAGASPWA